MGIRHAVSWRWQRGHDVLADMAVMTGAVLLVIWLIHMRVPLNEARWEVVWRSLSFMTAGFRMTCKLSILSFAVGFGLSLVLVAMRQTPLRVLQVISIGFVEGVRAVPQLMVIFWFFFTIPVSLRLKPSPFVAAVIALSVITSAYLAEIIRGGILAVPRGQTEAALASGLSRTTAWWYVVLPQGLRNMLPPVISQAISLVKTTSLVYVIGVTELMRSAVIINNRDFAPFAVFLFVGGVYLAVSLLIAWAGEWLERRFTWGERVVRPNAMILQQGEG